MNNPEDVSSPEQIFRTDGDVVSALPPPCPQAKIENGFVILPGGDWLVSPFQPTACRSNIVLNTLKGWIVPDRSAVRRLTTGDSCWLADSQRPFLTRLEAMPDQSLNLISSKFLASPFQSRCGAGTLRVIPLNFRNSLAYTEFRGGWAIAATCSRVTRIAIQEGETIMVRPEALVAWFGEKPTGFCPKLSVLDMILPRNPNNLTFSFYGPAIVWLEGGKAPKKHKMRFTC